MRILHLFKTYRPDNFAGVEGVIWNIAEGTAPPGVESTVLFLSRNHRPGPQPIGRHLAQTAKLDLYLASTGLSISAFGEFARLAARADLIHYHFPWPMMDLLHLYANGNKPSVVTYHSDIVRQRMLGALYRPLMVRFLGKSRPSGGHFAVLSGERPRATALCRQDIGDSHWHCRSRSAAERGRSSGSAQSDGKSARRYCCRSRCGHRPGIARSQSSILRCSSVLRRGALSPRRGHDADRSILLSVRRPVLTAPGARRDEHPNLGLRCRLRLRIARG